MLLICKGHNFKEILSYLHDKNISTRDNGDLVKI